MRQIYEYHPVTGFRFIPQTKVRMPHAGGGYLIRTNEAGFRSDRPFAAERKPGVQRVLLFGDSFTAGEGVSNGQRYSDHLERLLPGLEIYNLGMPATGLDQHYLIYREFAQGIEHDLLVIAVYVENVRRVGSRFRYFHDENGRPVLYAKPYYTLERDQLQLHCVPPPKLPVDPATLNGEQSGHVFATERFPWLKQRYKQLTRNPSFERLFVQSGLKDQLLKLTGYEPVKEYSDPHNPSWMVMRALIRQWIQGHSRPVMLLPIPLHHHVYGLASPRAYQACLREATASAGGQFVEPLGALMARSMEQRKSLFFPDDGHLTKAGHEALAQALAPSFSEALSRARQT